MTSLFATSLNIRTYASHRTGCGNKIQFGNKGMSQCNVTL